MNLRGQHIDQHLRIAGGIGVTTINLEQILLKLKGVGEIAVVNESDAIGGIHIERLNFLF